MKHKTRQVALTLRFKKKTQSLLHHSTGYQICIQPCAEINKNNSNCQRSQAWMMCAYHKALIALEHCRLQEMSMPLLQEAYRQLCTATAIRTSKDAGSFSGDGGLHRHDTCLPRKLPTIFNALSSACPFSREDATSTLSVWIQGLQNLHHFPLLTIKSSNKPVTPGSHQLLVGFEPFHHQYMQENCNKKLARLCLEAACPGWVTAKASMCSGMHRRTRTLHSRHRSTKYQCLNADENTWSSEQEKNRRANVFSAENQNSFHHSVPNVPSNHGLSLLQRCRDERKSSVECVEINYLHQPFSESN